MDHSIGSLYPHCQGYIPCWRVTSLESFPIPWWNPVPLSGFFPPKREILWCKCSSKQNTRWIAVAILCVYTFRRHKLAYDGGCTATLLLECYFWHNDIVFQYESAAGAYCVATRLVVLDICLSTLWTHSRHGTHSNYCSPQPPLMTAHAHSVAIYSRKLL